MIFTIPCFTKIKIKCLSICVKFITNLEKILKNKTKKQHVNIGKKYMNK